MQTRILQEDAVLVVQYDGQVTFKSRGEVLAQILPILREKGIRRLLVDFTGAWPTREKADAADEFASKLASARPLEQAAIAYLNAPHGHTEPAELVAPVVGFQIRRFYNRRHALEWLQDAIE